MTPKKIIGIVAILVLAGTALSLIIRNLNGNSIAVSGLVEADEAHLGSTVGGRVEEIHVQEGNSVKAGTLLVTLEAKELESKLQSALAQREDVAAQLSLMKEGARKEDILIAKEQLKSAESDYITARSAEKRANALYRDKFISSDAYDTAKNQLRKTLATKEAAQQKLMTLESGNRPQEIAAAEARLKSAGENVTLLRIQREESNVTAPYEGFVESIGVKRGDIVAPSQPVVTLLSLKDLYVRVYVPEHKFSFVKLGQKVKLIADAYPNEAFEGVVEQIMNKAEFTPKNISTREDRENQVFGVKVRIAGGLDKVRAGMTVEAHFVKDGE